MKNKLVLSMLALTLVLFSASNGYCTDLLSGVTWATFATDLTDTISAVITALIPVAAFIAAVYAAKRFLKSFAK